MPETDEHFLYTSTPEIIGIRASHVKKTYIGADFCADEEPLRDMCQVIDAQDVLDLNQVRVEVQSGIPVADAIDRQENKQQNLQPALVTNNRYRKRVTECLNRIAIGACQAYPIDN